MLASFKCALANSQVMCRQTAVNNLSSYPGTTARCVKLVLAVSSQTTERTRAAEKNCIMGC